MAHQIFAAEISHQDAPLHVRERLLATEAAVKEQLGRLAASVQESFVLSTCNRFTVYVVNDRMDPLQEFFQSFPGLMDYTQFYPTCQESVTHLFAVASGLLARIKGDSCVSDQLTECYRSAVNANTIGITMDCLLREAVRVSTQARTQSGLDKFCSSVVDVGIAEVARRAEGLRAKKILVIGTGKVARMALKCLHREGARNVSIISQDFTRASELADAFGAKALELHKLQLHARDADVIVGGTHYEVTLFSDAFLKASFDCEKTWYILDFGMPRNFNWQLADHPRMELYNLDDVKRMHKSPLDDFGGLDIAWKIVMNEAKAFMDVVKQLNHSPILLACWRRLADLRHARRNLRLPPLENLGQHDLEKIRTEARRLMKGATGHHEPAVSILSNNLAAQNARDLVLTPAFEKIRLNLSVN